jgi:hypothetical protein
MRRSQLQARALGSKRSAFTCSAGVQLLGKRCWSFGGRDKDGKTLRSVSSHRGVLADGAIRDDPVQ